MGCHLHDVLELHASNRLEFPEPSLPEWVGFVRSANYGNSARHAMCFYAGETEGLAQLSTVPGLIRLPYPICWIEHRESSTGALVGVLCTQLENLIKGEVFISGYKGRWLCISPFICGNDSDGTTSFAKWLPQRTQQQLLGVLYYPIAFLSALNCTNVRRVEHTPSLALQKARARRGKLPLFSHWTLELDLSRPESHESRGGGEHASPRLHLRRGHPRQYMPGKWCWVQPHVVGNKAIGMVHKEYKLKEAA